MLHVGGGPRFGFMPGSMLPVNSGAMLPVSSHMPHEGDIAEFLPMAHPNTTQAYGVRAAADVSCSLVFHFPCFTHETMFARQVGIRFTEKVESQGTRYRFFVVSVIGIYTDSPADRSRTPIQEGDILMDINGHNVQGLSLAEVAPRIIGPLNTPIQLGFKRPPKKGIDGLKSSRLPTVGMKFSAPLEEEVVFAIAASICISRESHISLPTEGVVSELLRHTCTSLSVAAFGLICVPPQLHPCKGFLRL